MGTTPTNLKLPLINHTSCDTYRLVFICTSETSGTYKHRWFCGRMLACHAGVSGSIPGRCSFPFYFHFNIYLSSASCNLVVEKYIAWNQTKIFSSWSQVLGQKKISPFFSFFLVFLWLTCAISSDKSHYFISSEKSHYFLQFTIQPLPRSILIY